jgi:uncharacterized membrane protein YcaP (DUF421 family)
MFKVFLRGVLMYFIVILSVRIMGKRQIGELQPGELVITILMSNVATLPVEDPTLPLSSGVVPIFTLVLIDVLVSALSMKFRRFRRFMSGSPIIVISDGKIDKQAMHMLRLTADDLMSALRTAQVFDFNDVQLAVVETTGKISVCPKKQCSPPDCKELGISPQEKNPPVIVIDDGEVAEEALRFIRRDYDWLDKVLAKEKLTPTDIFIMTADSSGDYRIIKG